MIKPEKPSVILVFRGIFAPKIFHPMWFSKRNLLPDEEAQQAKIAIISDEICEFQLDWLLLQVTRDRILLKTTFESHYEALKDLALGMLSILNTFPVTQLGINFESHYRVDDIEKWNMIGDLLAPKDIWTEILNKPGLRRLEIESIRHDSPKERIITRVEPSLLVQPGVFFFFNNHFEVKDVENCIDADEIMNILKSNWSKTYIESTEFPNKILQKILS